MKFPLAVALIFFVLINPLFGAEDKAKEQSFSPFWMQFKAAVANKDKEAIAGLTKFPFNYGKKMTKADFMKQFDLIFNAKVRKCFQSAKPTKETNRESYTVFCGEDIFTFAKENGEYRLTDLDTND